MSYTRPAHNAVNFDWQGTDAYTRPAHDAVDFSWTPEAIEALWVVLLATIPAVAPPVTMAAGVDYFVPEVAGVVTDAMGHPVQRRIRVFERDSSTFIGETLSDPVTGAYQFQVPGYGEYQRIAMAEDESDPLLNDLIDRVKVEWPEA